MVRINLMCKFDYIRPYLKRFEKPQLVQGIYFLCDGPKLLYIGSSMNIMGRIADHFKDKVFNSILYLNLSNRKIEEVREAENALITYFNPPLNSCPSWQSTYWVRIPSMNVSMTAIEYAAMFCEQDPGIDSHPIRHNAEKLISEKFYAKAEKEARQWANKYEREKRAEIEAELKRLNDFKESITIRYLNKQIKGLRQEKREVERSLVKVRTETQGLYGLVA